MVNISGAAGGPAIIAGRREPRVEPHAAGRLCRALLAAFLRACVVTTEAMKMLALTDALAPMRLQTAGRTLTVIVPRVAGPFRGGERR